MIKWKIYNEDAVEWAKNYQKAKFHALLCDAPYHLTSIVKRFGKKNSAPAKEGTDGVFRRASSGFMGQQWDGGDLAFRPETWEAFGEVLHPGAFGMAFSASRNWHRMAVAIEGFLSIHPSEMIRHADLLYHARHEKDWDMVELVEKWMREQASMQEALSQAGFILHPTIFLWAQGQGFPKATNISKQIEKSTMNSDDIEAWEGHRYGLQALKPAVEPIIVFQKPYEGRPLDNIVETGAGALNIEASRIGTEDTRAPAYRMTSKGIKGGGYATGEMDYSRDGSVAGSASGRWPSNLILDGTAELLDKQSGIQKGGFVRNRTDGARVFQNNGKDTGYHTDEIISESDGGASRFFYNVSQQLDESDPVYYCSKVSPKERNAGLDDVEDKELGKYADTDRGWSKFYPDGTERPKNIVKNNHPTLKPIDLCRYLATLLLPPIEYAPRRIFIPFSGVASEMIGAGLAGWEHVVGVEFDTENSYVDIAEKRLQHWLKEQK